MSSHKRARARARLSVARWARLSVCLAFLSACSCGDDDDATDGSVDSTPRDDRGRLIDSGRDVDIPDSEPIPVAPGQFTYTLSESTSELTLFTTPVVRKLHASDAAPSERRSGLSMHAARNEVEPALLAIEGSGNLSLSIDAFPMMPAARITIAQLGYEEGVAERLSFTGNIALDGGAPTGVLITIKVPEDAPAGDHATTLHVGAVAVPLTLHVFDFALPREIHFASQLNVGISGLIPSGGGEQDAKDMLFEHRLTPSSPPWPSGFGYDITWDTDANPNRCSTFYDEPSDAAEYSIQHLAAKYLEGDGWNGVGFPDSMLFGFVDNSTPRPTSFCGESRGDHYSSGAYNTKWSAYLAGLAGYLRDHGYIDRSYWYVQNEPQGEEDYALAAHLCRIARAAAPDLRIMISEEPKPEIAERSDGACGYDIWLAHVGAYQAAEAYAWARQRDHGEQVWLYSLDHDAPPLFNPTKVTSDGFDARIVPWASFRHRARGWAYYDGGRFFDGATPKLTAELLREGFEDYEYLWLANGRAHPAAFADEPIDATVRSVASSMTSFTHDADAFMAMRIELGRFIEGSRETAPLLTVVSDVPRVARHLDFGDPSRTPASGYEMVGWTPWDDTRGLGWVGENVGDPAIALYGYDDDGGYSEQVRSYVYDDYGRKNLFELEVAPGRYMVAYAVGRPARGYPGDPYNLVIEGTVAVNDVASSDAMPVIEGSAMIDVTDGRISVEVGGISASTGAGAYTFLGYLDIVPVD